MKKRNGYDRQFKITSIIYLLITKFCKYYMTSKELSVDGMTFACKGKTFLSSTVQKSKWGYKFLFWLVPKIDTV